MNELNPFPQDVLLSVIKSNRNNIVLKSGKNELISKQLRFSFDSTQKDVILVIFRRGKSAGARLIWAHHEPLPAPARYGAERRVNGPFTGAGGHCAAPRLRSVRWISDRAAMRRVRVHRASISRRITSHRCDQLTTLRSKQQSIDPQAPSVLLIHT